jgi:hypothetical protein
MITALCLALIIACLILVIFMDVSVADACNPLIAYAGLLTGVAGLLVTA